jgi:hypothetical protein
MWTIRQQWLSIMKALLLGGPAEGGIKDDDQVLDTVLDLSHLLGLPNRIR